MSGNSTRIGSSGLFTTEGGTFPDRVGYESLLILATPLSGAESVYCSSLPMGALTGNPFDMFFDLRIPHKFFNTIQSLPQLHFIVQLV